MEKVEFKFAVYDCPKRPKRCTHYRVVSEHGKYFMQQYYSSRNEWDEVYPLSRTAKKCYDSLKELMDSHEFQWLLTYKNIDMV